MNVNNSNRPKREAASAPAKLHLILILSFLVSGLFGICFAIGGFSTLWQEYQLRTDSATTTGTVTDLEIDRGGEDTDYYIVYIFKAQDTDGETRTFMDKFSAGRRRYEAAEIGQSIPVVYATQNPNNSRLYGLSNPIMGYGFGLLFLAIGIGSLGFFVSRIYRLLYQIRWNSHLERDGLLTTGTITDRWETENFYYVAYQYEHGEPLRQQVALDQYRRLSPGETVTIRYLPGYPYISRIEDI